MELLLAVLTLAFYVTMIGLPFVLIARCIRYVKRLCDVYIAHKEAQTAELKRR